jgi:hypothetical protein
VTSVHIDGVTIGDGGTVEDVYTLTSISGWRAGVDFRRTRTPRPAAHGEFPARGYKSGRLVRVEFEVLTPPDLGLTHVYALDRVMGILDDGRDGQLSIEDGGRKLTAMASRYGEPTEEAIAEDFLTVVALRFLTPDPRRYGEVVEFPAATSLELFHEGNSSALPVLKVAGPSTGYSLTFSIDDVVTDVVTVPGDLASGEVDVLSGGSQWVRRAGAVSPLLGVTGHVPEIPRGKSVTVTIAGAPSVAGEVTDTYS